MSTTQSLVTKKFKVENAKRFVQTVTENEAAYYMFAGRHIPYEPDDSIILTPNNSVQSSVIDIYDNMLFGKRIYSNDIQHMIPKYEWSTNEVYEMYDHERGDLFDTKFYSVVNIGTNYNVYKCLDNNNGANSTVEPSGTDITPFYTPSDGYLWKYMFTVPEGIYSKFSTTNYIPVVANSSVIANATPGSIEHITIVDGGSGYNNYYSGEFRVDDLRLLGNELIYALGDTASSLDNFYQGCVIKVTSGSAADEYKIITDYAVVSGKKRFYINTAFINAPQATDTYEVYPFVYLYGDGYQTVNCDARAIISSSTGNSISRIELLNVGENYRAATAVLNPLDIVGVTATANLKPIISPKGGHGANPLQELGANKVGLSVKFSNTENGFIPILNDYRTVGIIKDPQFDNLTIKINTANTQGNFIIGESISQYRSIPLTGSVSVTTGSSLVTGTSTYFDTSLVADDYVYITDGLNRIFTQVSNVINSTSFNCTSNILFTSTGTIALINSTSYGIVSSTETGSITITHVETKNLNYGINLFGKTSYTVAQVNAIATLPASINGKAINGLFDTFVELSTFVGTITSANTDILPDEGLTQESLVEYTQPSAKFHSYVSNTATDKIYVSNIKNIFMSTVDITNTSNTVVFNLSNKYLGDLVRDSGEVLYIENLDPITRASNKSESIKVILEF
jgi:hypothetical protein